ncbi:MAG: hypothetical protein NTV01_19385 [Bacteroidia bacterium]|nr:hypothetical protein [Bacteroidia bacterium]
MKTKNQITIIILITGLLVTGIVYGDDPVKDGAKDTTSSTSGTGLGWQELAIRTHVLVSTGLNLSTDLGVSTKNGFIWNLGFSTNLSIIDCCKPTTIKAAWCNFDADDVRCED